MVASTREWFAIVTGKPLSQKAPDVLRASRRLAGLSSGMGLQKAIRVISSALAGVTLSRSTVVAMVRHVLDPNAHLDRATRIRAATALSAVRVRVLEAEAVRLICLNDAPLDIIQAAAASLLGPPRCHLNAKTVRALTRHIRRYGQIRGPATDLLRLSLPSRRSPSKAKK